MHDDRLEIYLNDHLAMLSAEVELAERCRSNNDQTPLADFLTRLAADLKVQEESIRDVLARIGRSESYLKQGAAWLAEKVGRFKINDSLLQYSELSRLLELEMLTVAAMERVLLWETLGTIVEADARFMGSTFAGLREQAHQHLDELSTIRRVAAQQAFLSEE